MFGRVLKKVFKSKQERDAKKLQPIADKITSLESDVKKLSDDELRAKTGEFKGRLGSGETLDDILPEAFSVVREVAQRTLGQRHYDVQLMGGIALHNGSIAEMRTGEGKTLAATLAVYLNSLLGRGAHIATVNDYLAKRDAEWMGSIYRFLGMSVSVTLSRHDSEAQAWDKQVAYQADITYGIASEFGFDYLRDNSSSTRSKDEVVQRELYYTIVDEVDSVLIDEAKNSLIISGDRLDDEVPEDMYKKANAAILPLKKDVHYTIDRKESKRGRVMLTEEGIRSVEKSLGVKNLYGMSDVFEESTHYLKINGAVVLTEAGIKELEKEDSEEFALRENLHYIVANKTVVLSLDGLDEIEARLSDPANFELNIDYIIQNNIVLLTEKGLGKISETFDLTNLKPNAHYITIKEHIIILTESGIKAIEKALADREPTILEDSPPVDDEEPATGEREPILQDGFHYLTASSTAMLTEEGLAEIEKSAAALTDNTHYVTVTPRTGKRKTFLLTEDGFDIIRKAYKDISFDSDEEEKRETLYVIANQEPARKLLTLTREGIRTVNELIKSKKLYDDSNIHEDKDAILRKNLAHYVDQALTAHTIYESDVDYVVQEGEVILIDESTGRLQYGRRLSDGLHQAIEAKERAKLGRGGGAGGVKIEKEMHTVARISYQNYFRMYEKLSGMTGTAETEAKEFLDIYKLEVVIIPTNEPMIRIDHPDVIYKTVDAKYQAIINEIIEFHQAGRPVLVGTPHPPEKPAEISRRLRQKKIPHQVLTAKDHTREASIIAQAGVPGAVTVATNMAGRGVDILLGGNPEILTEEKLRKNGVDIATIPSDANEWKEALQEAEETCAKGKKEVLEQGGLHLIGTERHDSRRIDNQLRGRAGRQGDPGSSRFYLALEDDLMLAFGGGRMAGLMSRAMEEDIPLEHNLVSKSIEKAQRRREQQLFEWRKNELKLDDVMNMQRGIIYEQRRMVLDGEELKDEIFSMFDDVLDVELDKYFEDGGWIVEGLLVWLSNYGFKISLTEPQLLSYDDMRQKILASFRDTYREREEEMGFDTMRLVQRQILLRMVDRHWENYLHDIDYLIDGIWLRGAEGRDPIITFKTEAHDIFSEMTYRIKRDVTNLIFHASMDTQRRPSRRKIAQLRGRTKVKLPGELGVKVGRNDLCPCGSGKKYKRCCGW